MRSSTQLFLATLVSCSLASAATRGIDDDAALSTRIAVILANADDAPVEGSIAAELARLGPAAVPVLFDVLESGSLPASTEESTGPFTTEAQQTAVLDGIDLVGRSAVLGTVAEHAAGSRPERLAVLRILERVGDHRDLAVVARAAKPTQRVVEPDVLGQLAATVEEILLQDVRAYPHVRGMILNASAEEGTTLIDAVAAVPRPEGMTALAVLLGFEQALDADLLRAIGELARQLPHSLDATVRSDVRDYLLETDDRLLKEASLAAGKLRDHEAVPLLVDLLDSESRAVRENSLWAVRTISGLQFGEDPKRWELWSRSERLWFDAETPKLFNDLRQGDLGRVVRALNALATHRYRRDEIANEIAVLLDSDQLEQRELACIALGQLGSPASIPLLIATLENDSESVNELAWVALRTITAKELPLDADAWREEFLMSPIPHG
jgi:HEAT repeat protein